MFIYYLHLNYIFVYYLQTQYFTQMFFSSLSIKHSELLSSNLFVLQGNKYSSLTSIFSGKLIRDFFRKSIGSLWLNSVILSYFSLFMPFSPPVTKRVHLFSIILIWLFRVTLTTFNVNFNFVFQYHQVFKSHTVSFYLLLSTILFQYILKYIFSIF